MCPIPVIVLGDSARAARATSVGASSPPVDRSSSTPRMRPVPETVSRSPSRDTSAPKRGSRSARSAPTWVVVSGQPEMVTLPPATRAAARNGAAFERSGSMSTSAPWIGPGATIHSPTAGLCTVTPRRASVAMVISMCGRLGRRSPEWRRCRPCPKRGAASSRPETNWLDVDASMVISPPTSVPVPCTVKGRAPRPSSLMSAPRARRDEMVVPIGRRRAPASPSKVVGPRPSVATGGRKRITVPARPQSTVVDPSSSPGVILRSEPNSPAPGTSSMTVPS